jgi:hypothetical protein
MTQAGHSSKQHRSLSAQIGAVALALLALGLLAASSALATYEQVGTFAGTPGVLKLAPGASSSWPEEVQLGDTGGMAVNYTGAGGVPAGTVYATNAKDFLEVARFNPNGTFSEAWSIDRKDPPGLRCGPDGNPVQPTCTSVPGGGSQSSTDVDVDQVTGNVYVASQGGFPAGSQVIYVYSPDGSELIAQFGEVAPSSDTIAMSPEKIHAQHFSYAGSIAVDALGDVYVFDAHSTEHRLMKFEPQAPGDYEHYVYAGQSQDLFAGPGTFFSIAPVIDSAGNIYVIGGSNGGVIAELDPSRPSAPPVCEFEFPGGQIQSMTVNPQSGEVFFFSSTDRKFHQLSACNGEGEFAETAAFGPAPKRTRIGSMALDPVRQFDPDRPAGVLYAGSVDGTGGKTEGTYPNNLGESALGYVFSAPVEAPPKVESESVSRVTATTATLGAQINPRGSDTRYAFQYITEAAWQANEPADRFAGAEEAPPGGGALGSGQEALGAAAPITGLLPDTAYRYRAVATSHCSSEDKEKVCEGTGPDQLFRTFPAQAPGLPDERAWELVSPADKHGGEVMAAEPLISSCNGLCKPGFRSLPFPLQSAPDGEAIAYKGQSFFGGEGAVNENEYIARRSPSGWQTKTMSPVLQQSLGGHEAFDPGLTRGLIFQSKGSPALSPDAPSGYANLYTQSTADPLALSPLLAAEPPNRLPGNFELTYAGASADLSRVFFSANDALSEETPFAPQAEDGGVGKDNLYEWVAGGLHLVNVAPGNAAATPGAAFGARGEGTGVGDSLFHAISTDGSRAFWSDEAGQVYVRENAESTKAIPDPGKFLSASADGSKVLLTDGHVYDLETEATTDLTEGKGGFLGILGQSEDFSHLYFVDTAVLDEAPSGEGEVAKAGKDNLYSREEGSARFVATLAAQDNGQSGGDWASSPSSRRTAEASPDGSWVAFLSQAPLTGYDNTCKSFNGNSQEYEIGPCSEAFLYDSATDSLACASCNPTGERPLGLSVLRRIADAPASLPQPRYLSDEGRLFFDSRDSLSSADTNDGVEDVYQYEPEGVGSCKRQSGCVNLISAGHEPVDSNFLAADPSGKNVFFTTRDQLTLKDRDELIDLYDARAGGGIAAETETARTECQGEACQGAVSPPNDPTPGSSSFEGAGNVEERKAAKKHKKKKHAKKHKNGKHAHKRAAKHNRGGAK